MARIAAAANTTTTPIPTTTTAAAPPWDPSTWITLEDISPWHLLVGVAIVTLALGVSYMVGWALQVFFVRIVGMRSYVLDTDFLREHYLPFHMAQRAAGVTMRIATDKHIVDAKTWTSSHAAASGSMRLAYARCADEIDEHMRVTPFLAYNLAALISTIVTGFILVMGVWLACKVTGVSFIFLLFVFVYASLTDRIITAPISDAVAALNIVFRDMLRPGQYLIRGAQRGIVVAIGWRGVFLAHPIVTDDGRYVDTRISYITTSGITLELGEISRACDICAIATRAVASKLRNVVISSSPPADGILIANSLPLL